MTIVAGLISAASSGVWMLSILRGFVGIGLSGAFLYYDLVAELIPTSLRGQVLLVMMVIGGTNSKVYVINQYILNTIPLIIIMFIYPNNSRTLLYCLCFFLFLCVTYCGRNGGYMYQPFCLDNPHKNELACFVHHLHYPIFHLFHILLLLSS